MSEKNEGNIRIADEVISSIVSMALVDTSGVGFAPGTPTDVIGRKKSPKGVRVNVDESGVSVEVAISVEYGNRILDVAKRVQTAVRETISDMTGMNVLSVDVHVLSLKMPKKEPGAESEKDS